MAITPGKTGRHAPAVITLLLVSALVTVFAAPASGVRNTFTNDNGIAIQDFVFENNTTSITINDDAAATPYPSTINVPDIGFILDVDVQLNSYDHTFPDDVDVMLVGPAGRQVTLMSDAGGGTDAVDADLNFDDEAAAAIPDADPIVTGSYRPGNYGTLADPYPATAPTSTGATSLSVFDNTNPQGNWRLFVVDDLGIFAGDISGGWSLLFTLRATPYPSPITVTGLPSRVTDVNVTLGGLTHTFPADLDLLLVGPGGQQATIMSDTGGSTDVDLLNLTLDDEAAAPLPAGALSSGTFRPTNLAPLLDAYPPPAPTSTGTSALSVFDGTNPNGQWRLFVKDAVGSDQGTLQSWSLDIETDASPPTGTVSINGGAATTNSSNVILNLSASDPGTPSTGVTEMRFSNDNLGFSAFQPFAATAAWTLSSGDGVKTVFVQYRDASGNVSGSASDTITLDSTGPHSTKTKPTNKSTNVARDTKIKITANEALSGSTVNKNTVILKQKGVSGKIKAKVSYNAAKKMIVITPKDDLKNNKTYKVTVKTSVKDLAGNGWDENTSASGSQALKFSFTT